MTYQEEVKRFFIRHLKNRYKNIFSLLYKEYYNNKNTRFLYDMMFKSFHPIFMFSLLWRKSCLKDYLDFKYETEYVLDKFIRITSKRKRFNKIKFTNKTFKATTEKEKEKLFEFCIKYGIIHYTHENVDLESHLKQIIKENNVFLIDNDLMLYSTYDFMGNDITLDKLIYIFEKEANIVNEIKFPFFKRIYYKWKYE